MLARLTDKIPPILTRMGALTVDSTIYEAISLRQAWEVLRHEIFQVGGVEADRLLFKLMESTEYRNWYRVTAELFGPWKLATSEVTVAKAKSINFAKPINFASVSVSASNGYFEEFAAAYSAERARMQLPDRF